MNSENSESLESDMDSTTVPADEYLSDVLQECIRLLESALRLAAAQSNWQVLDVALSARSNITHAQKWLREKSDYEA